jgi:AraC-like DNA-binding protein
MKHLKQFPLKPFGVRDFSGQNPCDQFIDQYREVIKIIYLSGGGRFSIDLADYDLQQDCLLFIRAGQYLKLPENSRGSMLYYTQGFYGVQLHDQQTAWDEQLFTVLHKTPLITLDRNQASIITSILDEIKAEIMEDDINLEEMVRVLLKQIIIRSTRFWKRRQGLDNLTLQHESGFSLFFLRLVENNFLRHHDVASYAKMLNISAKALSKRVTKSSGQTPLAIIQTRIILEAKRMLIYTPMSIKEIGYKLGYRDPSYFIRFFTKHVQIAPQAFRINFQDVLNAVA